ncbi:acyl-CoA dehydrogenase family protein [Variovorax sp. PCZ-1]|uniref:acyl-CoA dehydrogenase family protein n=1 Tax=Variovorax sp. PCZ-1 TaxID=2835533 RepID=UPI001BCC27F2|nr:acyl-CoA dehydrogenase family protein [Variovorax sp. PCZ-1]MBS7809083.1 acyl-CoA dehydrogenase family protein [Variovorax sp. PCZ-1]
MNLRASTKHLSLPFFEAQHKEIGNCLADWLPKQNIDESDDRAACKAWVKLLGANQWLRYCVPAAHGGAFEKIDSRSLVILRENLAFHSALADFAFAMQGLGSGSISLAGSPELQKNYLPQVARGEKIAAFALSEPDAGSDVAAMNTVAVHADSAPVSGHFSYEINGKKTWISNGGIADFYCVFAKTDMQMGSRGISAFVMDANTKGLDDSEHIDVIAPHPLALLKFDACKVPGSQMLGEENAGFKLAMATLDIFRPSVAAAALGFARRALHEAREYAQGRKMFGKTLADQQITQAKLGEMAALIDAGAVLTYRAAWMRDVALASGEASREDYTAAAAMAKMVATENANKVIDMALQMHGGMGVKVGTHIEALYRDIRALRIYEGATEVQQLILGKSVLTGVI